MSVGGSESKLTRLLHAIVKARALLVAFGIGAKGVVFFAIGQEPEGSFDVNSFCRATFRALVVYLSPSPLEERMYDVTEQRACLRRLRNAALLAVVIPAALVAGCSSQPAPPPPAPVAAAPPPPPMPAVRG